MDARADTGAARWPSVDAVVELAGWRRRVAELYVEVRQAATPRQGWARWCAVRADLFATHPQSPLAAVGRGHGTIPQYFAYDAALRVSGQIELATPREVTLLSSSGSGLEALVFGRVSFELSGSSCSLPLHWLGGYAGGLLVCFRDRTSGVLTSGSGRYLLDTAKGADLGTLDGRLVLDFNFAYQPSCSYDPHWACPLPSPESRLDVAISAGERMPEPSSHERG